MSKIIQYMLGHFNTMAMELAETMAERDSLRVKLDSLKAEGQKAPPWLVSRNDVAQLLKCVMERDKLKAMRWYQYIFQRDAAVAAFVIEHLFGQRDSDGKRIDRDAPTQHPDV